MDDQCQTCDVLDEEEQTQVIYLEDGTFGHRNTTIHTFYAVCHSIQLSYRVNKQR